MEELMIEILDVVAVLVAGLLVGNELAIAVFIHPTIDRLPDDVHLPVASALARVLGKFLPFWYIGVILLTATVAMIQWHQADHLPVLIATSVFLWLLSAVYSIIAEVPINNRIASMAKGAAAADWKPLRRRWDLLHCWRVVLLTIALVFLILGVISK
jgi:uncharacterized membrane protein